jgi:hypothetical protein
MLEPAFLVAADLVGTVLRFLLLRAVVVGG